MTEMPGSFWLPRMSRLTRRLPATRVMQRSIQQLKRRCEPFASLRRTFPSYRVSSVTWVPYQAWHVPCLNEQFSHVRLSDRNRSLLRNAAKESLAAFAVDYADAE